MNILRQSSAMSNNKASCYFHKLRILMNFPNKAFYLFHAWFIIFHNVIRGKNHLKTFLLKQKLFSLIVGIVLLLNSLSISAAEIDLLGLTLDVKESGVDVDNVNITVEIYDAATGGNVKMMREFKDG